MAQTEGQVGVLTVYNTMMQCYQKSFTNWTFKDFSQVND